MSTFFVNVACFFVFFVASLHHVHPEAMNITIFQNGESNNFTKVNTVKGDQILSKKRESVETLAGPETARDRRFTIIENDDVAGNQIIRGKRQTMETLAGEETNQNRRNTFIETNRVAGNQILSKKRESIDALAGPETARDRRFTVIGDTVFTKSGKVFRTKREIPAGEEINQNRRNTFIETNRVAGDQILSKKRESVEALAGEETNQNRRNTFIETNNVDGNQILHKKRESGEALAGQETDKDRRMTVIEHQVIHGGQIFDRRREIPVGEETNQNRRNTFIETNRVAGDQILSKKSENVESLPAPEMVRNRRMTVFQNTQFVGLPRNDPQLFVSSPIVSVAGPVVLPNQSVPTTLRLSNPTIPFPTFVKELTVNGNQFLSKKKRESVV